MTIGAAMVPSEEELLAYRFICQRDSVEAVQSWNAFIESGKPRTIVEGLLKKTHDLAYKHNFTTTGAFLFALFRMRYALHNNPVVEYVKSLLGETGTEAAATALRWLNDYHLAMNVISATFGGFMNY